MMGKAMVKGVLWKGIEVGRSKEGKGKGREKGKGQLSALRILLRSRSNAKRHEDSPSVG